MTKEQIVYVNTASTVGHDRATEVQTRFQRDLERIRQNKNLSAVGRKAEILALYKAAQAELDAIRDGVEREPRRRREELERQLFGSSSISGADAISFRDAYMRAAELQTEDEALGLLETTQVAGDRVLAKAVAQAAVRQRWIAVLNLWADEDPRLEARIEELLELNAQFDASSAGTAGIASLLAKQWTFTLQRPHELSYSDVSADDGA